MSKFAAQTNVTVNNEGHAAYAMDDRSNLVTKVLTCMFGEPKYYGNHTQELIRLAEKEDMAFVARLAVYARKEMHLRSVAHVLTAVVARFGREYIRATVRGVVERADDITEILAAYISMYGKPVPNGLKKALGEAFNRFDEYSLAKYKGEQNALKMRDAVRIVHPKPETDAQSDLYRRLLANELATPVTWETMLSAFGNTASVWNSLIDGGKLGYMALLRNLRNIAKSGSDRIPKVCATIADPEQVRKSKQLPFRFYSAWRMLRAAGVPNEMLYALERAMDASVTNAETIPGNTLIAIDVSGSMTWPISENSDVRSCDIALVLAAMARSICENATIVVFDTILRQYDPDPEAGILETVSSIPVHGGGTNLALPLQWALRESECNRRKMLGRFIELPPVSKPTARFDRMILLSDNEINRGYTRVCQTLADEYRRQVNPDFWVHAIDMQGYGTQQFQGNRTNIIAGWSENVFPFIMQAERGMGGIVQTIETYPL